jgi:hypothetical protein
LIAGLTRFVAYLIMLAAVIGMFFDSFPNKRNSVKMKYSKKKEL